MKLNQPAHEYAQRLIAEGKVALDGRDDWSEHQPTAEDENRFIEEHGMGAYARWHLGIDEGQGEDTKARYRFPYGDFEVVHRCGVLAAESRAGQYKHFDIERAAAHLLGELDALMKLGDEPARRGG
ncbi:MAG TPA: hypothetical protein VG186_14690 [Solirubrobacteraceae bacterium]|jgi:hypothetical protein|nr:hypothetical protein [Solirubrobacteraceae bacterium]